ncbi:MAG: glycosyltransferase family 39 protein [Dehalococcoidales bacterium]|nr:glycosyltransferase family 39 protein [Dehalococcoidales bacterium]
MQGKKGQAGSALETALIAMAVLAVTAVGFALRICRLSAQSFWYDEGISVTLAGRNLAQITQGALADIHPPVYYYVLHFWMQLAGNSEFSVRFVSVAAGVLAVCLLFNLARRLFTSGTGLAAAVLLAVAPLAVYYGQEARMYSLLLALTLLWTIVWLKLLNDGEARTGRQSAILWGAYLLLALLCVYTHYFAFLLLAFQGLWMVIVSVRRPRLLGRRLVGPVATVGLYIPWVLNMSFGQLESFRRGAEQPGLDTIVWRMFDDFTLGHLAKVDEATRWPFLAILALGLIYGLIGGKRPRRGMAIAALYLLVPVAGMLAMSTIRPAYQARLMLLATPGLYLLLGLGVAGLAYGGRRLLAGVRLGMPAGLLLGAGALVVMVNPIVGSLQLLYYDQEWQRDDFHGVVQYIVNNAAPDDAVVLDSPGQIDIFSYYWHGSQDYYPVPSQLPLDEQRTQSELADIVAQHKGVWAIIWGTSDPDPHGFVEQWLDRNCYKTVNTWFGGIRLARYVVESAGERQPLDLRFGDNIRLKGYAWLKREGQPGGVLPLILYWEGTAPIDTRYTVFAHVLDEKEKIWGQRDSEPAGGASPTTGWQVGQEIEDRLGLPIQEDTAPGTYQVEIGMYDPATLARPTVFDASGQPIGDRVLIGPIRVGE